MTTTDPQNSPQNDDQTPDGTTEPPTVPDPAEPPADAGDETFSKAYVDELRSEAAKHRVNAKRADELAQRLVTAFVEGTGRLHDARDLAFNDDLLGDDGFPDREKVSAAVEALIKDRPHLAKIRPVGDVGQGIASDSSTTGLAAFGDLLRNAAS